MTSDSTALRLGSGDAARQSSRRGSASSGVIPIQRSVTSQQRAGKASRRRRLPVLLAIGDTLSALASGVVGATAAQQLAPTRIGSPSLHVEHVVTVAVALLVALHAHRLSTTGSPVLRPSQHWRVSTTAVRLPTAAILALAADAVLGSARDMTLTAAVVMVAPALVLVPLARRACYRIALGAPAARILVVGSGDVAERVVGRLHRCRDTRVVGHVDDDPVSQGGVLGDLSQLASICRDHDVDRVVVAFSRTPPIETANRLRELAGCVPISVVPRFFELHSWRSGIEELQGIPLLHVAPAQLSPAARLVKRCLDVVTALTALVVLAPVMALIAAAIRVDSPGPVLFRQQRTGRDGNAFSIYKYRTMSADAEARHGRLLRDNEVDGPLFKMHEDPRITRVGRHLRRMSLDELPQLLNVLSGDMSLVGPRPLPVDESARLDGAALARFRVAPGITGLWQVSGRSDLSYADLQHLDSVYVHSWSLLWDLRILLRTPATVFARRGAY